MDKRQELQNILGFSDKKATVYITLLEHGEMSATQLAKRSNLKRTTVYNILPELLSEGFISQSKSLGKSLYFINNVKDLERFIDEKKEKTKKLVAELQTNIGLFDFKPKVTLYEGFGGAKKLYQDMESSVNPGDTILTFIGAQNLNAFMPKDVVDHYVSERIKKKVKNYIIGSKEQIPEDWQISADKELREIRFANFKYPNFSGDFKIFGNKIAFLSYKENYFGLVIESAELSTLHKNMFYALWDILGGDK